jgi:2-alkyl-3-oxoalkanoate reductase
MRVLVTGASGVVGACLLPRLIDHGHEVVGTTRTRTNLDAIRALGAEPLLLDALDAGAVGETVARAAPEAIIHEMTALSGKPDFRHFDRWFAETNRLRTDGTRHLLAAAQATGVRRFVAASYTGWTNAASGGPVKTEADPLDPDPVAAQRKTLAAIRAMESAVVGSPLDGIIVRYANLYGPSASGPLLDPLRKRLLPIIGDGAGIWSFLHVDDAAAATVAALEQGTRGIYNIADDDPAPVSVWLPYLAEVVGAPKPMHVPEWLGRLLGGDVVVRMMTQARGSSNAKAKAELGWRPTRPSWRDGFRELAPEPRGLHAHATR